MSKMGDLSIRIREFLTDAENVAMHIDPVTGEVNFSTLSEDCMQTLDLLDDNGECDADTEDYICSLAVDYWSQPLTDAQIQEICDGLWDAGSGYGG